MRTIRLVYQPLILKNSGEKPTVPVIPTMTPNNPDWRDNDILIGQHAINYPDNKLYVRTVNGIEEINIGQANINDLNGIDFSDVDNVPDIALLYYDKNTQTIRLTSSTTLPIDGGKWN
jgi:hypothetical protein